MESENLNQDTENKVAQLRAVLKKKGYAFFESGEFNLNIIAIREDDKFENKFSDTLHIVYKVFGKWRVLTLPWTTLAGTLGFGGEQNPLTASQTGTGVSGTAIILEGQYRGAFKWVENGWQYPFLQYFKQVKPLKYLRDNDRNGIITRDGKIYEGDYQTHIHAMSPEGMDQDYVNYDWSPWSQGCQGNPSYYFNKLKPIVRNAIALWGDRFTYTLIHRKDFN